MTSSDQLIDKGADGLQDLADRTDGREVVAPSGPQLGKRPRRRGGPSPWLVVGVAFAAGVVAAKLIDWRGHAHPRG